MNSRFTLAIGAVVVGACTTMAMQDGGLARADDPPAAASKAEVIALQNAFDDTVNALTARLERLEADRDELQTTVAELESRSPGLGAYDAEGNWLGFVVSHEPGDEIGSVKSAVVWHPAIGRAARAVVTVGDIIYQTSNCTGERFLYVGGGSTPYPLGYIDPATSDFIVPVGEPVQVEMRSRREGDGECVEVKGTPSARTTKSIVPPFRTPIAEPITLR